MSSLRGGQTPEIVLQSPPSSSVNRRQPLLGVSSPALAKEDRRGVGEVAGGTAAECAAIFCCCPCALMNLLVLAVYKIPTGLCRKALKKKKRQRLMKKAALLQHQQSESSKSGPTSSFDDSEMDRFGSDADDAVGDGSTAAAVDFETEMLDRFSWAGFGRSQSQRGV